MKKLLRYFMPIIVAATLLRFLAYAPIVLGELTGPTSIFNGHFTAYNLGHTLGVVMRWMAFIGLAKLMWGYNRQWAQSAGPRLS
ncbi:hypothetical protein SAMN06265337_0743 [Hymenobacter gelipurpurascens]|uniref:Uncharacterized protein n=1 Tax=Hymenobacter gelipurpurascens TaxID=89968 RepID=A0A212T9X4_9BACT|nr:hypothetical protein [Hymenobacter gelipurpurascens]SNC62795.1 hypothetical protein SAMN06265337_0743 [Hymenobacter gelipurpurascens]